MPLVGYDSEHMTLDGKFNYEKENQRTLPFNVDIQPLPENKKVVLGKSSKENFRSVSSSRVRLHGHYYSVFLFLLGLYFSPRVGYPRASDTKSNMTS